ncbi:MAG: HAMP domain-containing protein [Treponema sp.]|nr:HAMP domain-containing protein [Treponema sp.]
MKENKIIQKDVSGVGVFYFADPRSRKKHGRGSLMDYGQFIKPRELAKTALPDSAPADAEADASTLEVLPVEPLEQAAPKTMPAKPAGQAVPKALPEAAKTRSWEKSAPKSPAAETVSGQPDGKVVFPIGLKMAGMITIILFVSLGLVITLVWVFFHSSQKRIAVENNLGINSSTAITAETILYSVGAEASLLWHNLDLGDSRDQGVKLFFETHKDVAGLSFRSAGKEPWENSLFVNEAFFLNHEIGLPPIFAQPESSLWNSAGLDPPGKLDSGGMDLFNGAFLFNGFPVLIMRFVLPGNPEENSAVVFFSSEELIDTFGIGTNLSFLINNTGDVLIHPDRDMIRDSVNLAYDPPVRSLLDDGEDSFRTDYRDKDGVAYFAAARSIAEGSAFVITCIRQDVVFEGLAATTRRNLYLSLGVWFLGVMILWFLAKPISETLGKLKETAEAIEEGQYHLNLRSKSHDEIGALTESMNSMSNALDNFEKLTNKYLVRLARKGRLALGGVIREATVFFSDIRSFTAISEKLSPQEVVEFLNDYMERIVACVISTGGVIDKFIGDAVMAHWGAVESAGSPARDALNAVRATLMMRASLVNFNRDRGGEKRPVIRIGCGLNSGRLIAGQIGSNERLEYTVIGETVSIADKTETFNKALGTEILITENTWRLVQNYLITEEMPSAVVNGKDVRIFAVINMADPEEAKKLLRDAAKIPKMNPEITRYCLGSGGPRNLKELRALLKIEAPNLKNLNLKEGEKKYRVTAKGDNKDSGPGKKETGGAR